jgi:hypothetical protein
MSLKRSIYKEIRGEKKIEEQEKDRGEDKTGFRNAPKRASGNPDDGKKADRAGNYRDQRRAERQKREVLKEDQKQAQYNRCQKQVRLVEKRQSAALPFHFGIV